MYKSSSIPNYFGNREPPIICYKYNKYYFNFKNMFQILIFILTSLSHEIVKTPCLIILQLHMSLQEILKSFQLQKNRKIVSKGPKYRFPNRVDFNKGKEEIASTSNNFSNR